MDNHLIAQVFQEIGDILEIDGANRFRVLAYQKAARIVEDFPRDLKDIYQEDAKKLLDIPGIGKDLAAKIEELIRTGKCEYHQDLIKKFAPGLLDLLRVRNVGPKKVKLFYATLQIDSIEKLRKAAQEGKIRELPGMGEKSETEILKALEDYDKHTERMMLSEAKYEVEKIIAYLKKCPHVKRVEFAGSLRRMRETVGDLDILVSYTPAKKEEERAQTVSDIMDFFAQYTGVKDVLSKGPTKSSVVLPSGVQVDLRVLDEKIFGAAMHYFTGSKDHNVAIRDRAKKRGLKINEYGVFKEEVLIGGATEEEVFKSVGLPYIIPEMRENRGEIEAADKGELPTPIELKDLRGDLHVHSKWSDGTQEIEEVARAYRDAGFEYIALTDHSPAVAVAHGLTPERFEMQWDEIDQINAELEEEFVKGVEVNGKKVGRFKILKGVECDILADGKMDLPDAILKKMDIVIASVHSRFNLPQDEQTARVLKAFQNPYVKIFGHPSGRIINRREPISLDIAKVIDAAVEHGIALEINSQPERLDLFDFYCKMAKEKGAKFTIDSDSHHVHNHMGFLRYGIALARRGWVGKEDVLNTLPLEEFLKCVRK